MGKGEAIMTGTHTRRLGLFRSVFYRLFGEPDESAKAMKKATSHGSAMMALGRWLTGPLMLVYSGAFILYLSADAMGRNFAAIMSGHAPNWGEVILIAVIWIMAGALDVAFQVGNTEISVAAARGLTKGKVWVSYVMVLAVAVIETATFTMLTAGLEHPRNILAWGFLLARSALAPLAAGYLATRRPHPPTQTDFEQVIRQIAGERIMDILRELAQKGEASLGILFSVFASASHYGPEQMAQVKQLEAAISKLDGNQASDTEQHNQLLTTLLHVFSTGTVPDTLAAQYPELAALQLTGMAKRAPSSKPASKADGVRGLLQSVGIEPCRTPKGKRGVWLASTTLPVLTNGRISAERATEEAKRLAGGGGHKSGVSYAFPFEALRSISHTLIEPLAAHFEANGESETPANVTRIDRARASA
jgi:hypothetical protein